MIEIGRRKCNCRVAIITTVSALNVVDRLADGRDIVVTTDAGTEYLCVIHFDGRREIDDRVAILADVRCQRVIDRLADGVDAIVTTDAVA